MAYDWMCKACVGGAPEILTITRLGQHPCARCGAIDDLSALPRSPREPDFIGPRGRAWAGPSRDDQKQPGWSACLGFWLMDIVGAHPFWSWWYVTVIHLRPIPGARDAALRVPGATHEVVIAALNPELGEPPLAFVPFHGYGAMTPFDLMHQVAGLEDADAQRIGGLVVRACVDGLISPDQDHRARWERMLDATAACVRAGNHRVN